MVDGYTITSLSTMVSGTTEITNTCTAVFNLTEVSKESDDGMTRLWEIQFMVFRVAYIIIIIGGTFGNILTFIVMQRGSLKEVSTCFYMSILALVDTGVLWFGYFPAWIMYITWCKTFPYDWTDCKLWSFGWYFFRQLSSALLVIMSVEKLIALYFPFKTQRICTVKTAKRVSIFTVFMYAAFNSQYFFTIRTKSPGWCKDVYVSEGYATFREKLNPILYSYGPYYIMGFTNIAIIYKFVRAKLATKSRGTESTNQALSNAAMRGTAILVSVSLMFIAFTAPHSIAYDIAEDLPHPIVGTVIFVLMPLNHVINGLIYCVVGSKFRQELFSTLCGSRIKRVRHLKDKKSVIDSSKIASVETSGISVTDTPPAI